MDFLYTAQTCRGINMLVLYYCLFFCVIFPQLCVNFCIHLTELTICDWSDFLYSRIIFI